MNRLILAVLLLAAGAQAGKSGYCYQIEPYGKPYAGQQFWVVNYKAPGSKTWKNLHEALRSMCDLNPLLVSSVEGGRTAALIVDGMGVAAWERQEAGVVNRCKEAERREAEAEIKARARRKEPPPPKPETVEICPL